MYLRERRAGDSAAIFDIYYICNPEQSGNLRDSSIDLLKVGIPEL